MAGNVADPYSRAQLRQTAAVWQLMAQAAETLEDINRKRATAAELGAPPPRAKRVVPPTLSKMRQLGVHELNVLCLNPGCRYALTFSADDYADETELSWFRPRMICAKCGCSRIDVRPNW